MTIINPFPAPGGAPLQPQQFYVPSQSVIVPTQFAQTISIAPPPGYPTFFFDFTISPLLTLQAHGWPSAITLNRLLALSMSISVPNAQLMTLLRQTVRLIAISQAQLIGDVIGAVSKIISLVAAEFVTTAASKASPKAIAITSAEAASLVRARGYGLTSVLASAQRFALDMLVSAVTTLQAHGQPDVKTLVKSLRRTISVGIADLKTLARQASTGQITYPQAINILTADVKTLARAIRHAVSIATADVKTLAVRAARLRTLAIAIGDAKTLATIKAAPRLITVAIAEAVMLSALRRLLRTISVAVADIKTLTAKAARTVLLLVSQSALVTLAVRSAKLLAVASADLKSLTRTRPRTITIALGQALTRTALRLRIATISILQSSPVTLRRLARVAIVINQAIAITLRRLLHKFVTVLQPENMLARASHLFKQAINSAHALLVRLLFEGRAGYKRVVQILGSVVAHYDLIGAVISTSSALGSVVYHWLSIGKVVTDTELDGSVKKTETLKGDDILKS